MSESKCVCDGNWRLLVNKYDHMIGGRYADSDGKAWTFFGLVWSDDDFYYGMRSEDGQLVLSTCVGSLEGNGYTPVRSGDNLK